MRVRLFRADIHYGGGLRLHTATSGAIDHLAELYLLIEQDGITGLGEVRANIEYLNGIPQDDVIDEVGRMVDAVARTAGAGDPLDSLSRTAASCRAPVRMLVDIALHDFNARRAGLTLAAFLKAPAGPVARATNQTLFWSPFEEFLQRAEAYVARGFRDLKVRVAAGGFAEDLQRLKALRSRFGDEVTIAIDANGCWSQIEAARHLDALAPLDITYAEQPIAAGDWDAVKRLAARSPIPIMLDEGVASLDDVARIASAGGLLYAHLKLVKLGGIAPTVEAARRLAAADVPFMIGQMNEGSAATAAALHVAVATKSRFAELYAADGLIDDPASGPFYRDGTVALPDQPGLGVSFDPARAHLIKECSL